VAAAGRVKNEGHSLRGMAETAKTMIRDAQAAGLAEAEDVLAGLANVFFRAQPLTRQVTYDTRKREPETEAPFSNVVARYQTLVEQIPAVVFMAYLDRGIGEAYVSPQIEEMLGFTQEEWLNDPVRWYQQIHPEDKSRWSIEAAQMFLSGEPLRSVYRVIARTGQIIWFHCEAKMVRGENGEPWFIHGVAFDITELKQAEEALKRREEELRALTASLLSIQDEERRRIARELHDGTAQNLAGLVMNLSLLMNSPAAPAEPNWQRAVSDSLSLAEQCSREVRNMSYLLHPPLLDDLGLASALRSYVAGFSQRTQIHVELELPADLGRLAPEVETALFRIVQEGLANVHRHSGSSKAAIRVSLGEAEVRLDVEDEGSGTQSQQSPASEVLGVGIPGMRERAQQLGGRMELNSSRAGTRITVSLPVGRQS
jgi:PAS domain S-box-containing protein